jgi:hypothetical protein
MRRTRQSGGGRSERDIAKCLERLLSAVDRAIAAAADIERAREELRRLTGDREAAQ